MWLHNLNDVVAQDDVAVGLLLLLRFACWPTIGDHPVVGCCCSAVDVVHLHIFVAVVVVALALDDECCAWLKMVDGDGRARCQRCC